MNNNVVFFDYLESLIKEDKIPYAFAQIEGFLHNLESTKGDVAELNPAKTHFALLENRYTRWKTSLSRTDSRDSQLEINQIVTGILDGLVLLKNLPDSNYTGFKNIAEPSDSGEEVQEVRSGRKFKWYWWVAIVLAVFSTAGVLYLLFHKEEIKPIPKPPTAPKKSLTLILHELGDRSSRSLENQGRLVISDMTNQRIGKDIGNNGVVRFDSLANWVFEAKPFVILTMQGLDQRVSEYRLLDSLFATFIVNDTVFVPFVKTEKAQNPNLNPNPIEVVEKLNLYFYTERTKIKKSFTFAKNSTVKQLKEFIISKFVDKDALRYGTETKLQIGENRRELINESQTLKEAKLKSNEVLYLHIIDARAEVYSKLSEPEQLKLNVKGQRFEKPVFKVNNDAVKYQKTKEGFSITMPTAAEGEKYNISIQDGDMFYTHEMEAPKLKEVTLEVGTMRKSAIKTLMDERKRVEPLQPKSENHR